MGARLSYLTDDDKAAIYEAALEIMGTIGQRVHHPEALELLRAAGAEIVEPDLVQAPARARREGAAHGAGGHRGLRPRRRAGHVARPLQHLLRQRLGGHQRLRRGDRRASAHGPRRRRDGRAPLRRPPDVDFVMAYAHPGDIDPHLALLASFRAMVQNTTKPLVVVAENAGDLAVMADIAEELRGGAAELAAKPYFVLYGEPTSALRHPEEAVDKLLLCADHGIPCVYSTSPLAGGTAPITVAGHVAQGAAESLLGPRRPPAAQAGRAVPLRHRPGRARHGAPCSPPTTRPSTSWATSAPWRWRAGSTCPTGATRAPPTPR